MEERGEPELESLEARGEAEFESLEERAKAGECHSPPRTKPEPFNSSARQRTPAKGKSKKAKGKKAKGKKAKGKKGKGKKKPGVKAREPEPETWVELD